MVCSCTTYQQSKAKKLLLLIDVLGYCKELPRVSMFLVSACNKIVQGWWGNGPRLWVPLQLHECMVREVLALFWFDVFRETTICLTSRNFLPQPQSITISALQRVQQVLATMVTDLGWGCHQHCLACQSPEAHGVHRM